MQQEIPPQFGSEGFFFKKKVITWGKSKMLSVLKKKVGTKILPFLPLQKMTLTRWKSVLSTEGLLSVSAECHYLGLYKGGPRTSEHCFLKLSSPILQCQAPHVPLWSDSSDSHFILSASDPWPCNSWLHSCGGSRQLKSQFEWQAEKSSCYLPFWQTSFLG